MKRTLLLSLGILFQYVLLNGQSIQYNILESSFVNEYLEIINTKQLQTTTNPAFNGPKQKMDSVITQIYSQFNWINQSKTHHSYNQQEQEISKTTYFWNAQSNQWKATEKFVKNFDNEGNITFYYEQEWNPTLQTWIPISLEEYSYNHLNKIQSKTQYRSWNNLTKKWKNGYRYAYHYTNSNLMEVILSEIDIATGLWNLKEVDKYAYNADHLPITKQTLWWNDNDQAFEPRYLDENHYSNNKLTKTVRHLWLNQWKQIAQLIYDYDNDNFLDQMSLLIWSNIDNNWSLRRKNLVDYNTKGVMIENQTYLSIGGGWVGTSRFNKQFDNAGNHDCFVVYEWDTAAQGWGNERKETSNFDFSTTVNELITPFPSEDYRHKKLVDSNFIWDTYYLEWVATNRKFYHYSFDQQITDNQEVESSNESGRVYPNPVKDVLILDYSDQNDGTEIQVFQMDGRLVLTSQIKNKQVNLEHLNNGIYIYKFTNGSNQYSGKIIKR